MEDIDVIKIVLAIAILMIIGLSFIVYKAYKYLIKVLKNHNIRIMNKVNKEDLEP